MNTRQRYPSALTDLQWDNIEHLFPQAKGKMGRPRTYPLREIVNAALYLARGGCSWRMLPHDFPPWKTVSYYFYTWRDNGIWEHVHAALRAEIRATAGKEPTFGWFGRYRRLSKDYEHNPKSSEAWIYIAMIHRMSRFSLPEKNRDDDLLKRPPKLLKA